MSQSLGTGPPTDSKKSRLLSSPHTERACVSTCVCACVCLFMHDWDQCKNMSQSLQWTDDVHIQRHGGRPSSLTVPSSKKTRGSRGSDASRGGGEGLRCSPAHPDLSFTPSVLLLFAAVWSNSNGIQCRRSR